MRPDITHLAPSTHHRQRRWVSQRAEGVISMAIAVLIIAALGVLMWLGFQTLWQNTEADISNQVNQIGG